MAFIDFPLKKLIEFTDISETTPSGLAYLYLSSSDEFYGPFESTSSGVEINVTSDSISTTSLKTESIHEIIPAGRGFTGEAFTYDNLAAVEQVYYSDFTSPVQPLIDVEGTELYFNDFEGQTTITGLTANVFGTVVASAVLTNSGFLEGNNYYVLSGSSGDTTVVFNPTNVSGVDTGRMIMLARPGQTASTTEIGMYFWGIGNNYTSDRALQLYIQRDSNEETGLYLRYSNPAIIGNNPDENSASTLYRSDIVYPNSTDRNNNLPIWLTTEWDLVPSGIYINVYARVHQSSDTIETVRSGSHLVGQFLLSDPHGDADLVRPTSFSPAWFLSTTSFEPVYMDYLLLEELTELPKSPGLEGIESYTHTVSGNEQSSSLAVISVSTSGLSPANFTSPEWGTNDLNPNDYYLSFPQARTINIGSDQIGSYRFTSEEAKGITRGYFRICMDIPNVDNLGLAIMRQGEGFQDNCYFIRWDSFGSTEIFVKKGSLFDSTTPFSGRITDNEGGSTQASVGFTTVDEGPYWIEIKWQATTTFRVEVSTIQGINTSDTSPGDVDDNLVSRLTYEDSSSPYLTTEVAPVLVFDCGNLNEQEVFQMELWRGSD